MQTIRMSGTIAVIGPLLVMLTVLELLSTWSGDHAFAAGLGTIREVLLVALVIWLALRANRPVEENIAA